MFAPCIDSHLCLLRKEHFNLDCQVKDTNEPLAEEARTAIVTTRVTWASGKLPAAWSQIVQYKSTETNCIKFPKGGFPQCFMTIS